MEGKLRGWGVGGGGGGGCSKRETLENYRNNYAIYIIFSFRTNFLALHIYVTLNNFNM